MLSPHALKHAERFVQEARMLANVNHPNVVRVHERGETKDPLCPYYTMEHLEAWSLREILVSRAKERKYGLKWSVAVNVMSELLYGLGALHEAGIVHRGAQRVLPVTKWPGARGLRASGRCLTYPQARPRSQT